MWQIRVKRQAGREGVINWLAGCGKGVERIEVDSSALIQRKLLTISLRLISPRLEYLINLSRGGEIETRIESFRKGGGAPQGWIAMPVMTFYLSYSETSLRSGISGLIHILRIFCTYNCVCEAIKTLIQNGLSEINSDTCCVVWARSKLNK